MLLTVLKLIILQCTLQFDKNTALLPSTEKLKQFLTMAGTIITRPSLYRFSRGPAAKTSLLKFPVIRAQWHGIRFLFLN